MVMLLAMVIKNVLVTPLKKKRYWMLCTFIIYYTTAMCNYLCVCVTFELRQKQLLLMLLQSLAYDRARKVYWYNPGVSKKHFISLLLDFLCYIVITDRLLIINY